MAKPEIAAGQCWRDLICGELLVVGPADHGSWHVQGKFAGWAWPASRIRVCEYLHTVIEHSASRAPEPAKPEPWTPSVTEWDLLPDA